MKILFSLLLLFLLANCSVEKPRAANSLCNNKKPVKCYAPNPNQNSLAYQAGAFPNSNCCNQRDIALPGQDIPLPTRGVSFTPTPPIPPSIPQPPMR